MSSFVFDRSIQKMVPAEEYYAKKYAGTKVSDLPSPQVMRDIEPFRNVAVDGAMIGSRSHKREMMKKHGLVEMGNERKEIKRRPMKKTAVREALKKSLQQLGVS